MPRTPILAIAESKLTPTSDGPMWDHVLKCGHSARSSAEEIKIYDRGKKREIVVGVSLPPKKLPCNLCPTVRK